MLNQTFSDFTLLVIDNNSQDSTCEIVDSFNDSRINFFRNNVNTGFCGGHNFAINNSESEFVLLVNPDIILSKNYVELVIDTIKKSDRIGTVCGLLIQTPLSDPECRIDSAGLELKRSGVMRMVHHGEKANELKLTKREVFGADGALPLYRRAMINDISFNGQFFDEMFFAHKEDWDVSWRANRFGWKTIFNPECIAIHPRHFKPKSLKVRSAISNQIKTHSVKNQLMLLLKNEKLSSFLINGIFIFPRQILIFLYIILFERSSVEAYKFVFNNYGKIISKRKIIQKAGIKSQYVYEP